MCAKRLLPINSVNLSSFGISTSVSLLLLYLVGESSGLRVTGMNAPVVADPRDVMELDCHFDIGAEDLYSVKWYKDDQEFFRYMPRPKPNTMLFPVSGVQLISSETDCTQSHCRIRLTNLTRQLSGGAYKCEISCEAPAFRLASETHNVTIAAIPREEPKIEGVPKFLAEGDTLTAKCTSDFADPEPILVWKINGQDPAPADVTESFSFESPADGLVSRSITLRTVVAGAGREQLEVRCESAQPGVPISRRVATAVAALRSAGEPSAINNQKLHWSSGTTYSRTSYSGGYFLILVVGIRWSIWSLFK